MILIRTIHTLILGIAFTLMINAQGVNFLVDNYDFALQRAKEQNKLVFVDTYASWCKPCKKQEPVFKDKKLSKFFNEHFVNVKINMDNEVGKTLAVKHGVVFLPTLLILDPYENVRYRSDQSVSANVLSAEELISIAERTVFPNRETITSNSASVQVEKSDFRHVQHTPLPENEKDIASHDTSPKNKDKTESISTTASDEKILYVLGKDENVPPEILKEEAYFRLSLMDGSHMQAAKKYLASQTDWLKEENLKFLFDFIFNARSEEFQFMINNKEAFINTLGEEKVDRTIGILVYQTLERGFPQPDLAEAKSLYTYVDPAASNERAHRYQLLKFVEQGEVNIFIEKSQEYLEKINKKDHGMMFKLASERSKISTDKKSSGKNIKLLAQAILVGGDNYFYLELLAKNHLRFGDKTKAIRTARQAIEIAKKNKLDHSAMLKLVQKIESL